MPKIYETFIKTIFHSSYNFISNKIFFLDQLINSYGSELMAYQPPINCDLSELLDDDSIPNDCSMGLFFY